MSNETKKTALPKLRFPEFREAPEWKKKELGKLGKFTGGGTPSKGNGGFWQGSIPWVSSSDISEDSIHQVKITRFITEEALKESATKLVPENSILLVSRVGVGKLAITTQAVCTSQDFTNFTPANDDLVFIAYYLKTQSHLLLSFSQGMAIKGFTKEDVSTLKLFLPPFLEQQKIAATLSFLDGVITAQCDKLNALQTHKHGLMQGLFPAEGETVPKLRFPEFQDAEEWEEKKLGDVAELTSSKRIHLADYVPNGVPFFRGKEISLLKQRIIPDDILYISEAQYKEIKDKYGVPKIGDILITAVGTLANVYRVQDADEFYFKDGNLIWMRDISIDSGFLEVLLDVYRSDILASAIGSSQKALTMVELNKLVFKLPGKDEQQKIAECLSSLDDRITAQSQKIEALKLHKKSLMQNLFPAASEPTA